MAFDEEFIALVEPDPLFGLLECLAIEERYRSGHNGAASKADGRKPRGFESRPLRLFFRRRALSFLVAEGSLPASQKRLGIQAAFVNLVRVVRVELSIRVCSVECCDSTD